MESKGGIRKALGIAGNILACLVLSVLVLIAAGVLIETFKFETRNWSRILEHDFLFYGFIAFFASFIFPRVRSNVNWLMKFTHEFTHLLFAILFFGGVDI